jgi:hypothetical protein
LPIFGEKIGVFLKIQCYDKKFAQFSFVLSQKRQFLRNFFRRKYLKNHNPGTSSPKLCATSVIPKTLPGVNIGPMCENSPSLVTLLLMHMF